MKLYTKSDLAKYLKNDYIRELLRKTFWDTLDRDFASHKWLLDSPAKRMIFDDIYGGFLFEKQEGCKVLDVGGGFSGLTRLLVKNIDYTLLDIMAHDSTADLAKIENVIGSFHAKQDWFDFLPTQPSGYDYIIANDLFPNVDQRLEMFIEKFLPITQKLVMTLTFYDSDRFYTVKRVDADEVMTMLAWNRERTVDVLKKYKHCIEYYNPLFFETRVESLFGNGRQVMKVILRGR